MERKFKYDLSPTIEEIRPTYRFDVSCQGSVPQAIAAFLDGTDFESCVRLAVSLGGDADTIACIAGGIAQAYYGDIPHWIRKEAVQRLDDRLLTVVHEFEDRFQKTTP